MKTTTGKALLYLVSVMAIHRETGAIAHDADLLMAESEDDALEGGRGVAIQIWSEDTWTEHRVAVKPLDSRFIKAVLQMYLEGRIK